MKSIAILILAAGASTRFGSCKQLAKVGDKSLLQHCITTANQLIPHAVYVVLGANAQRIAPTLSNVTVIVNQQWQAGIGESIACGIRQLEPLYQGVLVLLADQPHIQSGHLQSMLSKFTGNEIVCGFYQGKRGVPAIFPRSCFEALTTLSGDQGAKNILQESRERVIEQRLPEAAFDIDTVAQLSALNVYRQKQAANTISQQERR